MFTDKRKETMAAKIADLTEQLDISRIKTKQEKISPSLETVIEQEKHRDQQYAINGEYFFDRNLQNLDLDMLKSIYRKTVSNFFILNNSVKDIIYRWPERTESIKNIISEEKEKLELGGNNCYGHKLYRFIVDGETVNQNKQDDLSYRKLDLPRRFEHESDIDRDPLFETPFPNRTKKPRNMI